MAHERDDRWRASRDDRYEHGGRGEYRSHGDWDRGRGRDERGFFERAGDEISSWFSGDERERGRMREERGYGRDHDRDYGRERDRGGFFSGRDEDRGYRSQSWRERDRDRDEDRTYLPMGWTTSNRDYRQGYDRQGAEGSRGYRPMTGDDGRGSDDRGRSFSGRERDEDFGRGSQWERDPYRRTSFAGSAVRTGHEDAPYDEMRRRHMEDLDRDYDEFRRENSQRFESDFGEWRERRQGKRQLLGRIREHMEVVGSDDEHVGTVDRVAGDKIILTKSDPDAGGHHHSLSCTRIDRVEENRVFLDMEAEKAREMWRDEDRERALFEREDQGEAGPHFLDRSFSGTYR